jgi:hypothetical protein
MGSSRPRNSKRVRKAHSTKRSSPSSHRRAGDQPPPKIKRRIPDIGAELRDVVMRLERVESYLIVAGLALDESTGHSGYVAALLRHAVGNLLFKQVRALEDLAAQCDGGAPSDRDHEDDDAEGGE